jgi:hypothetical protein
LGLPVHLKEYIIWVQPCTISGSALNRESDRLRSAPPLQGSSKPRVWSEKKIAVADNGPTGINYDVAPDSKRIAVLTPVEAAETQKAQNHIIFIENFFDELRQKVRWGSNFQSQQPREFSIEAQF